MAQNDLSARQPQEIRSQLVGWLNSDGWKVSDLSAPEAQWTVQAEDVGARKLVIAQMKNPPDQILIVGTVLIAPKEKQLLEALPHNKRSEILWDLRFRLLHLEFEGIAEPLTKIDVMRRIYLDGLTKNYFITQVFATKSAVIAVLWTIAKGLEQSSPPSGQAVAQIH